MPLLLVKQFAFDLEFLAVANALGFRRIREQPVQLDYRFTGSGVRSPAVLLALVDTAAIFYRLRILRYYQRKRSLLRGGTVARRTTGRTSRSSPASCRCSTIRSSTSCRRQASGPRHDSTPARDAEGEVVAFLEDGATPSRNWLESTVPFLANPEIAAVVTASMTPARGSVRERAAAALRESFLGGGSLYFRFTPGNLRFLSHFPAENVVVRKADLLALDADLAHPNRLCAALTERGRKVLYTPETVVVVPQAAALPPAPARDRGRRARARRGDPQRRDPRARRPRRSCRSRCSC